MKAEIESPLVSMRKSVGRKLMGLSITEIRKAYPDEWDEIWQQCDYATYFQSREWAELWSLYSGGKMQPNPLLICFSDSKRLLMPFTDQRTCGGLIKLHISSPAGTYGGWISKDAISKDHAGLVCSYFNKKIANLVWRLNPYDALSKTIVLSGFRVSYDDETQMLHLTNGFEAISGQWAKGRGSIERKARKARKEGVEIRLASSHADWEAYYGVYEDSLRRWAEAASQRYGPGLFQAISHSASGFVKLWLAIYNDTVIAGALCFYSKRHAVYWHGAALEEFFPLRATNLLMHEIIRNACEQGYHWFDFNPSGGLEGVKAFKKSFGAVELGCPVVVRESVMSRLLARARGLLR